MALSLFQEAQAARGLAVARALTGEQHDDERNLSPPISNNNAASIYSGLLPPTESAMRILGPHFLANQTAALLGIPISSLASSSPFFPTHPLFTAWAQSATANSSPPTSPISPALKSVAKKIATNNNHIVSTTTADLGRKGAPRRRQISVRKDIISPPARFDTPAADAPISPPTSGSSPQSTGSAEHATMLTSSTKDPTRDKVFTCKTCKRSFGYKHVLQNHERTHTGEKPFECPECHKRFTRDHHLKTHMRLHTGEKPYKCEECDRRFVQVANLRRHLRVHTGERPYPCDMCEARFSDSNQLKAHLLIHKGKKPFQCELCHTKIPPATPSCAPQVRHHGTPNARNEPCCIRP